MNCSTVTAACWRVKTVQHHCVLFICPGGHDGSVSFWLSFVQRKLVNNVQTGSYDLPIAWNQTSLYTFPSDGVLQWTAVYTDFNDRAIPFGSSNTTIKSAYLKASAVTGRTFAFSVYPFTVDAGSDLTIVPPTAYDPKSPVSALLAKKPEISMNPLTPHGFSALKAFAAKALSLAANPNTQTVVNVKQSGDGTRTATVSAIAIVSPAERQLNDAIEALSKASGDVATALK